MGCCDEDHAAPIRPGLTSADLAPPDVSRRSILKGIGAIAGALSAAGPAGAQTAPLKKLKLAFCSQILCIIPYEVARAHGHWKNHGLDVELVYARGGNNAMQALVGGAVDYAATALDVAIQAYAKGAEIKRFATTGRLPLFALVTAPKNKETIKSVKDLEGKTVGVSGLGQADHALLLFLLKQANADQNKVQFATLGVNILEALNQGQVDAGLVQEPALTILTRAGARTLVNAMDLRRRAEISRRAVRVHGRLGADQGNPRAPRRDDRARQGPRRRAQGHAQDEARGHGRRAAEGAARRRQRGRSGRVAAALRRLALSRQGDDRPRLLAPRRRHARRSPGCSRPTPT